MTRAARTIAALALLGAALSSTACAADVASADGEGSIATTAEAITNGDDDDKDPAVVALLLNGQVLCTGFLVTNHVVVTAAHCVDQVQPDTVYFGADPRTKKGTFVKVADSKAHPDFDPATLDADVAVIGLADKAPAAPLAVLLKPFDDSYVGMPLRVVGYGAKQGGGGALGKHVGTAKVSSYGPQDFRFSGAPSQTCEGDSGGPAFATIGGKELVVGITSSGDVDCKSYGSDKRMDVYVKWIAGYTKTYKAPASAAGPDPNRGCSTAATSSSRVPTAGWLVALGCALALCGRRRARFVVTKSE